MPVVWLYRHCGHGQSALSEADCRANHLWRPVKPNMEEKLCFLDQENKLAVGLKQKFTEDGWRSYSYKLTDFYKSCMLFTHERTDSLIFRRVGGPLLTLHLVGQPQEKFNGTTWIQAELKVMSGLTIFSNMMNTHETLQEFMNQAVWDRVCKEHMCLYDWECKSIYSPNGEKCPPGLTFFDIHRAYESMESGSLQHSFCGCQRDRRHRFHNPY